MKIYTICMLLFFGIYSLPAQDNSITFDSKENGYVDFGYIFPPFMFDARNTFSSNPALENQIALYNLGGSYQALLAGDSVNMVEFDLGQKYGRNGFNNGTVFIEFGYGAGGGSNFSIPTQEIGLGFSAGLFKGGSGMRMYVKYKYNFLKTYYSSGEYSVNKNLNYKIGAGLEMGGDWSFPRNLDEIGFFRTAQDKFVTEALIHDLDPEEYLFYSREFEKRVRFALPKKFGGSPFYFAPMASFDLYYKIPDVDFFHIYLSAVGKLDLMNFVNEGKRGQTMVSVSLGIRSYIFRIFD